MLANEARLTFDIAPPTPHTVVQEQGRLVVRFDAEGLDASIAPFTSQGYVQAVRPAETGAAIVVELGPRFASFRASDIPGDQAGSRLVLDVLGAIDVPGPPGPATQGPGTAPPPEIPTLPAPAAGLRTIVLDPGHGGDDTGREGREEPLEKDLALGLARRVKAVVESRLGARVLLTRDDDRLLGADERASLANNNKADLFVSLHLAASVAKTSAGAAVFVLDPTASPPDAAPRRPSRRCRCRSSAAAPARSTSIPWNRAQAGYVAESTVFAPPGRGAAAEPSRRCTRAASKRRRCGCSSARTCRRCSSSSGTSRTPSDEARLAAPETQAKLAQALADAIVRFDQRTREQAAAGGAR